jgi:hypothetical protein
LDGSPVLFRLASIVFPSGDLDFPSGSSNEAWNEKVKVERGPRKNELTFSIFSVDQCLQPFEACFSIAVTINNFIEKFVVSGLNWRLNDMVVLREEMVVVFQNLTFSWI